MLTQENNSGIRSHIWLSTRPELDFGQSDSGVCLPNHDIICSQALTPRVREVRVRVLTLPSIICVTLAFIVLIYKLHSVQCLIMLLRVTEWCPVLQPSQRGTPVSRGHSSNSSSVMISGDFSSFVKSQQVKELFYAPVGLYQVLLRSRWLQEGLSVCVSVPFPACPFCQAGHSTQGDFLQVKTR